MNLAIHKFFMSLFTRSIDHEDEEDRADAEYIRTAKAENGTFRPLRDVLADIEAEERGELHRSVKQSG